MKVDSRRKYFSLYEFILYYAFYFFSLSYFGKKNFLMLLPSLFLFYFLRKSSLYVLELWDLIAGIYSMTSHLF